MSDTHLGRGGEGPAKDMAQMAEEINGSNAEFTLFLGDLVDNGGKNEPQYPKWLETAKGLDKPFHPVPGSHDPAELYPRELRLRYKPLGAPAAEPLALGLAAPA